MRTPTTLKSQIQRDSSLKFLALSDSYTIGDSLSPEEGARESVFLESSPQVVGVTGKFFIAKPHLSSVRTGNLKVS